MVGGGSADGSARPEGYDVTEIPEHLLKRSRERRGAVGLPGGEGSSDASGSTSSSSAPAVAASAAPAAAAKAPAAAPKAAAPKPVRPEVLAAQTRKKIPFWAMPVLGLLPVWLFIYAEAMSPPTVTVTGPLAEGATVYANCSGCHGATGGGGAGYQLSEGAVHKTFPKFEDQLAFVANGSPAAGTPYGDPAVGRIAGARGGALMPVWKASLSQPELIAVICHERFSLQGLSADNPGEYAEEFAKWCAPDAPEFLKAEEAAAAG